MYIYVLNWRVFKYMWKEIFDDQWLSFMINLKELKIEDTMER